MNALQEVVDYLTTKLDATNIRNPSKGVAYLLENDLDVERAVDISFQIIQMQFTKSTSETPAGEARLTTVSSGIGHRLIPRDPKLGIFKQWDLDVRVGDLFIEAYYNTGFVDLYYPRIRNSFHVVLATSKWTELAEIDTTTIKHNIKGTVFIKPHPISGMMQQHAHEMESIIKGANSWDEIDTKSTWVKAINKLQRTGWRINSRILDAMLANEGDFISHEKIEGNKPKELKRRSKVIEWAFITRKAKYLKDQAFYQLMEADYRGRLYYAEPFLNFQGSDFARGLLKFARAKPMDEYGAYWLSVHTACCYNHSYEIDEIPDWCTSDYYSYLKEEGLDSISVDKMTLEDRVEWTKQNLDWIRKAGQEKTFYYESEKVISFLACCLEWSDYMDALESNQIHRTCLPIPIDGSNNGWQHLGAISKDSKTGDLVGLIPTEIQKDFYVQTAKELYSLTEDEEIKALLDRMPMKHIRKGISKRGSMTRAYSAGAIKIAENMWFDCKTEDYDEKYGITEDNCKKLARILVEAISNVCPGPLKTMGYLQALASVAIVQGATTLKWRTPSGFDVNYESYYSKKCTTKGTIYNYTKYNKDGRVNHVAQVYTDYPDVRGFMCGVSPNYIHSMDAAHMALVIDQWNSDFGAVHDSFSTHAPDVEELLAHTKQEFIKMYDVDNYYQVLEDQLVRDMADVTVDRPVLGDLKIEEIEDSDYFFA